MSIKYRLLHYLLYLASLFPALQELVYRYSFVLRVVGAGREIDLPGVQIKNSLRLMNDKI